MRVKTWPILGAALVVWLTVAPCQAGETRDGADGLAWGIGTGESLAFGTMGLLMYGDISDSWIEPVMLLGMTAAGLGGAGLGVAAHINVWPAWIGRAIHGVGTGLGEAVVLGSMAQEGGDEIWGEATPQVWGVASAFAVAAGTASALGIDSYQEFLTVAAFQAGGLLLASVGGAGYKIAQAMCSGADCATQSESNAVFMATLFTGLLVGHVTGLTLMCVRSPEKQAEIPDVPSAWQRLHLLPTSPSLDGMGLTATLIW